jgi:sugar phosphate isomerase/epimerase
LLDAIDEPAVSHLLDVSHVHAGGGRATDAVAAFGRRIGHVHLRDARGDDIFHLPGDGEVDFRAFFAALDHSGYDGACAIELEGRAETLDERRSALARSRDRLLALGSLQLGRLPARVAE